MPSNSGNYPGVDPDGRNPGGLEIAGNVDVGSLSLLGQSLAFDNAYGRFERSDTGQSIPHGTTAAFVFDNTDVSVGGVVLAGDNASIVIPANRLFLVVSNMYWYDSAPASGVFNAECTGAAMVMTCLLGMGSADTSGGTSSRCSLYYSPNAVGSIVVQGHNGGPDDKTFGTDVLVIGLGNS